MVEDERFYEAAERRIEYFTFAIGLAGAIAFTFVWGIPEAVWFAVGAAFSWINFRWMKQGIGALARLSAAQTGAEKIRVPRMVYVKFLGRYLLLVLMAYVMLRGFKFAALSLLAGLFALAGAVLIEMMGQLFRKSAASKADS